MSALSDLFKTCWSCGHYNSDISLAFHQKWECPVCGFINNKDDINTVRFITV